MRRVTLFVSIIAMAIAAQAATSYGFKVGGITINSDNYTHIAPDDLDKGTITYDPASNTVTFTNVNMYRDGKDERVLHNLSNNGLTVKFVGSTLIKCEQASTLRFEANTTITTDFNSETETVIVGGSQEAIYVCNSCRLYFKDIYGTFYVRGSSIEPIAGDGKETIFLENADVHVQSGYNTNNDKSVLSNINTLQLNNNSYMYLYGVKSRTSPTIKNLNHLYYQAYMDVLSPSSATFNSTKKSLVYSNGDVVTDNIEFSYMIPINSTTFPNEGFRNYVLENIDKNGHSGYLNSPELSRYGYRLSLNGMGINDLKGIEFFSRYIRDLYVSANLLTSLTLKDYPQLTNLYCAGNKITALNLSNCPKLDVLNCSSNALTSLDVKGLPISSLDCSFNALTTLDVSTNMNLPNFKCSNNQIKGEGLSALINSLPALPSTAEPRKIFLVDHKSEGEGNECTAQQVTQARDKGWVICHVMKKASGANEWVSTSQCVNYDLTLAGQRLGSCLRSDTDYRIDGVNGSWNYNNASKVLTLDNATITYAGRCINAGSSLPGLKIAVNGISTLNVTKDSQAAIFLRHCDGAMVEGGRLDINCNSMALYLCSGNTTADHRVTIKDCEINVSQGGSIGDDEGDENLTIENSIVRLAHGFISTGYDLQLVGCAISKPAGGFIDRGNINAPGNGSSYYTGEIEILPITALRGDVNGDGFVNGADVTALYGHLLDGKAVAGNADVSGDGIVSGADVTALYNLLLQ